MLRQAADQGDAIAKRLLNGGDLKKALTKLVKKFFEPL